MLNDELDEDSFDEEDSSFELLGVWLGEGDGDGVGVGVGSGFLVDLGVGEGVGVAFFVVFGLSGEGAGLASSSLESPPPSPLNHHLP